MMNSSNLKKRKKSENNDGHGYDDVELLQNDPWRRRGRRRGMLPRVPRTPRLRRIRRIRRRRLRRRLRSWGRK